MKLIKNGLALILVLAMLLTCLPVSMAAAPATVVSPSVSSGPVSPTVNPPVEVTETGFAPAGEATDDSHVIRAENVTAEDLTSKYVEMNQRFSETEAAATYASDDQVTFIVVLEDKALLEAGFDVDAIAGQSAAMQAYSSRQMTAVENVQAQLMGALSPAEYEMGFVYTIATTGFSLRTAYGNKATLEAMDGVEKVYVAPVFSVPETSTPSYSLQPMTSNATTMIGANILNESGYTGVGTKIAVLDTGIYKEHPNFQALPEEKLTDASLTREGVEEIWDTLNASQNPLLNTSYISSKIPFAFNYVSMNYDVSHANAGHDHGTHVAGIAAANKVEGSDVVGVAPDAQLVVMQVFGSSGADWATILAALEDAIRLDVDTVNMSLGAAAGFTDADEAFMAVMDVFATTDIELLIATGNETNNAFMNRTGLNMSTADSPDIGLLGTPSSYSASLAVASVDNDGREALYFTVGDRNIGFNDTAATVETSFYANFAGQTLTFVAIDGYGTPADYEGVDVAGKVAVVSRGTTSFPEKQAAAQAAGAIACLVYNNVAGIMAMQINDGEGNIPCVSITQADGQYLLENSGGTLTVCQGDMIVMKLGTSVSDFSSWGVTPDLKLKPELSGVGGGIYSTRDPGLAGSNYGDMSGTSMATPQVAGAAAVLLEYLRKNTDLEGEELRQVAANLLMSTANTLMDGDVEYTPRSQGAGLINLVKATTSGAYLTNYEATEGRPKAELGDDDEKTGVYTFSFDIVNYAGTEALSYTFDTSVLTETLYADAYIANTATRLDAAVTVYGPTSEDGLLYDFNGDGTITTADARALLRHVNQVEAITGPRLAYTDVNADGKTDKADVDTMTAWCAELEVATDLLATGDLPGVGQVETVTVQPGEKATITIEIVLTEDDKAYLDASFPSGMFVEGYVYVNAADEGGVDLVLPYVGFYGDWSAAPVFDKTTEADANLYPLYIFNYNNQVGTNPYIRNGRAGDEYNAFSYSNPMAEIDLGLLRNVRDLQISVTDTETGEVYWTMDGYYLAKTHYNTSYGMIIPLNMMIEYGEVWDGKDADGNLLPNGTKVCYKLEAWLDDGDDVMDGELSFEITVDDDAPEVTNQYTIQEDLVFRSEDNHVLMSLDILENEYVAAVIFISPEGSIMGKYELENVPGQAQEYVFDITGYGSEFTIVVADYACNETEFDVLLDLGEYNELVPTMSQLDKNRIYGCETFDAAIIEAGWFSASKLDLSDPRNETFDSANRYYTAEFVNGYVIGQNANTGHLELITPTNTYWKTQVLAQNQGSLGDSGVWYLYDMALDHSGTLAASYQENYGTTATDALLAVGWMYRGDMDNDGHDDGYNALFNIKFTDYGDVTVQPIGAIYGTENGGDVLTLGITTEGAIYGIDTDGILYSLSAEKVWDDSYGDWTIPVTKIGVTDFVSYPGYGGTNVIQSMGYDHNTGKMYWFAHSQVPNGAYYENINVTYIVDLATGDCTEVGTYGASGQTGLFIPNDLESDLFVMGVQPKRFEIVPGDLTLAQTQTARLRVNWTPWNAAPSSLTWESDNAAVVSVDDYGTITAVGEGTATISASGECMLDGYWDTSTGEWIWVEGGLGIYTATCTVHVVPSQDEMIGFMIDNYATSADDLTWITYADVEPTRLTDLGQQMLPGVDQDGNEIMVPAMWQGGAYFQGYVYTVVAETKIIDNVIYNGTALYKSQVLKSETGITLGEPQYIGFQDGMVISAMGFDYNTSRMYCVENQYIGGLGIMDLDTGLVDMLGQPNGDLSGSVYIPGLAVTGDGTIVISDAVANLYTINPDTLTTKLIHRGSGSPYSAYYEAMYYDHDTGNLYWNMCDGNSASPLSLVILPENEWEMATVVDLGAVGSKKGAQQTVMFSIPDQEPEAKVLPVESIDITNGDRISGLQYGSMKLDVVTVPARPTVQAKTWTSTNEKVVTVDRYGVMTFQGLGTATVTVSITNKDEATYGGPFTDSIEVTVVESAGEFVAFLNADEGGSQFFDFWLTGNDYDLGHSVVGQSMISIYSLRSGTYYDGYFYAYTDKGDFLRIDAENPSNYRTLGKVNLDTSAYQVTAMAFDYTTGTMFGLTLPSNYSYSTWASEEHPGQLVTIDLNNGQITPVATLDFTTPVFALACDLEGQLYAAGGSFDMFASSTQIFKLNKTNGTLESFVTVEGANVFTGATYYGTTRYNSQMTYDIGTNRLYLNASVSDTYASKGYGMFMVDLDGTPSASRIDGIRLDFGRGEPKNGEVYLGLLAFLPEKEEVPVGKVNGILLNKTAGRVAVGGTAQIVAEVRPSNAADTSLTWTSSDPTVAKVDANGTVTGLSVGSTVITATSNESGISATCTINVVELTGPQSLAYTASAQKDALISFNPALPAQTAEVVTTLSGGSTIKGMTMANGNLLYLVSQSNGYYLYRFDTVTGNSIALGQLYTFSDPTGLAYDEVNDLIYVTAGFYIFQFQLSALDPANFNYYSNYMMDSDYCTLTGVVCIDGAVYTVGNDYYTSEQKLMKYSDKYLSDRQVLQQGFPIPLVAGATDFAYDPASQLFYFADPGNNIYTMDLSGNVTVVDILGDGIDLNGFAIQPAEK